MLLILTLFSLLLFITPTKNDQPTMRRKTRARSTARCACSFFRERQVLEYEREKEEKERDKENEKERERERSTTNYYRHAFSAVLVELREAPRRM